MGGGPERLDRVHRAAVSNDGNHRAARQCEAGSDGARQREADAAARKTDEPARIAVGEQLEKRAGGGQRFFHDHRVCGQCLDHAMHQIPRIDRAILRMSLVFRRQFRAPRRPVVLFNLFKPARSRVPLAGAERAKARNQRHQRFAHVGLQRDLDGIVLPDVPVRFRDLHDGQAIGQGVGRVVDRHAQRISAETDQQIMGGERLPHLGLVSREAAHERAVCRWKMRGVGHGLLVHGRAKRFGKRGAFFPRLVAGNLVSDDHDRPFGLQQPARQALDRGIRWARGRLDAG